MGPATKRPGRTRARPHRSPGFVAVALACTAIVSGWASVSRAGALPDSVSVAVTPIAAAPALATPRLGGYFQAREIAREQVGLTALLNRARFSIDGALPSRFSYRALVELEASAGVRNPAIVSLG